MPVDVVLGLQRGDEGKGRIVDLIANNYKLVARFNGGPNAGHTVANNGGPPLRLHQLPSGIARPDTLNVIGNGMLLDPLRLVREIDETRAAGIDVSPENLVISDLAHLILPHHICLDEIREAGQGGQDTTKRGIAFVARDKYERVGIRAEVLKHSSNNITTLVESELKKVNQTLKAVGLPERDPHKEAESWTKAALSLAPYISDTVNLLHKSLKDNQAILAEGAQAFGLDIEFGMYPFVTSSHTTVGGAINGLGIDPHQIRRVVGVAKALKSHVGGGPFVTEIKDVKLAEEMRGQRGQIDSEYGASTGRMRKVGYLDLPELRRAVAINGVTELAFTKLDVLSRFGARMPIATHYRLENQDLLHAPSSAAVLEKCQPVYKEFDLWSEDISDIRKRSALPSQAQTLLKFLEQELGVPITMVGVGPGRHQVILQD